MVSIPRLTEEECYLLAILAAQDGVDLGEFALTDPTQEHGRYRVRDYQRAWYQNDHKYQISQSARAVGKALALDTPIATPGGWTTMGELQVGDQVFDESGMPTWVIEAHEVRHNRPCFEVIFSDGSVIVSDEDHRWLTWDKRARRRHARGSDGYPSVRTTQEIAATLMVGKERNHSIEVAGSLKMPEAELPLDPWVLGYWLGNGNKNQPYVSVGWHDLAYAEEQFALRRYRIKHLTSPKCPHLRFDPADSNGLNELRRIGVLNEKHIPLSYMRASENQRRELLAGLFDSDGHLTAQHGQAEITLTNQRLAQDVFDLICTLGEKPTISESRATIAGVDKGPKWRIGWAPQACPAFMPRKAERWTGPGGTSATHRRIIAVNPVPSVPVRCISVSSGSSLYLAGRTLIPTHNTESIKLRAAAMPFALPGRGMLVTAPELNHLKPLTDILNNMLMGCRLLREMLPGGKAAGINLRPHWQARFKNGTFIISRLPNVDGRGVKGIHVTCIELDEGSNYPAAGWVEVVETLNSGDEGSCWRVHGVSTGARDSFYEKSQPGSGWVVHQIMAMMRPTWSGEERHAKTVEYGGSRQAIDYRRNIYGEHGDKSSAFFVSQRLLLCVDTNTSSAYNTDVYKIIRINDEKFPEGASDDDRSVMVENWIDVPDSHLHGYSQTVAGREVGSPRGYAKYFAGGDVGITSSPTELLVFGQRVATDFLELLLRIQLLRVKVDDQQQIIKRLFQIYGDTFSIGIDKNGPGEGLVQPLERWSEQLHGTRRVWGFKGPESRIYAIDDRPLEPGEKPEDLIIKRPFLEASMDWLRNNHVDARKFRLPYDTEVIRNFQGQTVTTVKDPGSPYGIRRQFNGAGLHALDAVRQAIGAMYVPPLEEALIQKPERAPVIPVFLGMDFS